MQKIISTLKEQRSITTQNIPVQQPLPALSKTSSANRSIRIQTTQSTDSPAHSPKSKWKIRHQYEVHNEIRNKIHTEQHPTSLRQSFIKTQEHSLQKQKAFFTNFSPEKSSPAQNQLYSDKKELHAAIEKSRELISVIKSQKKKLIKLKIQSLNPHKKHPLDLSAKAEPSKDIYNYLSRHLVVNKNHQIDDQLVDVYVSHSPPGKLQPIQQKSRKFLLNKMYNDYSSHSEVETFKKQHIKSLILEEINQKKTEFQKDYRQRYNIPYFSFLTLNKQQQKSVLSRKSRHSLV